MLEEEEEAIYVPDFLCSSWLCWPSLERRKFGSLSHGKLWLLLLLLLLLLPSIGSSSLLWTVFQLGLCGVTVEHSLAIQKVAGSNLGRSASRWQPCASCSHACASVTKQYNLVPAGGRWRSSAGKVTIGPVESNGSLPPGGWLSHLRWLPVHRDQLRAQRSVASMGELYLFYLTVTGNNHRLAFDSNTCHCYCCCCTCCS